MPLLHACRNVIQDSSAPMSYCYVDGIDSKARIWMGVLQDKARCSLIQMVSSPARLTVGTGRKSLMMSLSDGG